ncbi:hypothetical protein SAY87_025445 [Trapa incisa]|uniref:SOSEKI DIX-like domain-containing protein n=1 Tax=Trapa incisa TaxID=236973 RepID=A0AAN7GME2_9MYRT|nr:hypothetical protein SAY87_025445 [Trapa incisa]
MAEISPSRRRRAVIDHIRVPKKWPDREPSPDPIRIWRRESAKDDEPDPETPEAEDDGGSGGSCGGGGRGILTAHVLYYLSVNSQLQHPHFIEVPLSSSQGLYLRGTCSHPLLISLAAAVFFWVFDQNLATQISPAGWSSFAARA